MRLPNALESRALRFQQTSWQEKVERPALVLADALGLSIAYFVFHPWQALGLVSGPAESISAKLVVFLGLMLLAIAIFWLRGHYSRRLPRWHEIRQVIRYALLFGLLHAAILFFGELAEPKLGTLLMWFLAPLLIIVFRDIVKSLLYLAGGWTRPALIIGHGANAIDCARAVENEFFMGLRVSGFVATKHDKETPQFVEHGGRHCPVMNLEACVVRSSSDTRNTHFFLAIEPSELPSKLEILNRLSHVSQNIYIVPAFRGLPLIGLEASHFFGRDLVVLLVSNTLARRAPKVIKRIFDIICSTVLITLLLPILGAISLYIAREGNVLYAHRRIGQRGRPFTCYKFRTMVPHADQVLDELLSRSAAFQLEWMKDFKLREDPRVTPFGRFLRRTSLDELPQLWNVLKGDMSLVGPRPIVEKEIGRYGNQLDYYLEAKPGITGLWQISGRNDADYATRVQLDAWYVKNWSIWYDLVILAKTARVVLARRGAY